jgi:hypothetical protein
MKLTGPRIVSTKDLSAILGFDREIVQTVAATSGRYYKPFDTLKKRGNGVESWRHIDNPTDILKKLQTNLHRRVLKPHALSLPIYLVGGLPKRSILDNANPHVNKECVVGMDLTKCFDHINNDKIYEVFISYLGFGRDASALATQLTTIQRRLPQGSSASSILCNMALRSMAAEVNTYCVARGLSFTMYIDDITLSGDYDSSVAAIGPVIDICRKHSMHVNKSKTHIMKSSVPQVVTGHGVNKKVNISNAYIAAIDGKINEISRAGYAATAREIYQVWSKIEYVNRFDPIKGRRIENYANSKIKDLEGIYAEIEDLERRPCKGYSLPHDSLISKD